MDSSSMKSMKMVEGTALFKEEPFTGKLVRYDSLGKMKYSSSYVNGLKEGKTFHLTEGNSEEVVYDSGMRVGKYLKLNSNQDTVRIGYYSMDKRDSVWKGYYDNGQISSVIRFSKDSMHGKFVLFHENGQIEMEGEYLNGAEHGRWDFYNTLGRWIQGGNYNKGRIITRITEDPIGIKKPDSSNRTTSFANGQIKSTSPKKNGKPHGDWIGYYENGQIRRITHFEDGKAQGKVELFYEDGSLKKFETRLNGKRVGETKSFYKSGQLDYQGQYDSYSEKDGTWLYYSESGDLGRKIDYLRGKLIKEEVF